MRTYLKELLVAYVCFVPATGSANSGLVQDETYSDNSGGSYQLITIEQCQQSPDLYRDDLEAMSCKTQRAIKSGIEATQITLGMCTFASPLPMQAKVAFGLVSSVALPIANFVLNHIPCDSDEDEQEILINMCTMLFKQGVNCDPNKMIIKKEPLR